MVTTWPNGWWEISNSEHRRLFREEFEAEVGVGHPLKGLAVQPIARADGRDDYLFQLEDGRAAEVHLTFANRPERPPWPAAVLYASLDAWRSAVEDER